MHLRLPVLLVSAALLVGLVIAPSASADRRYKFALATGTTETAGRAKASGTLTFVGGHDFHQVQISGRINDICPGDGHSAVLTIQYQSGSTPLRDRKVLDARSCAAAARSFSVRSKTFKKPVTAVSLRLEEISHDANGIPTDYGDSDRGVVYPV